MDSRLVSDRARVNTGWVLAVIAMLLVATIPFSYAGGVLDRPGVVTEFGTGDLIQIAFVVAAFVASGAWLIHVRPRTTGRHDIETVMSRCAGRPCWFAFNVYSR